MREGEESSGKKARCSESDAKPKFYLSTLPERGCHSDYPQSYQKRQESKGAIRLAFRTGTPHKKRESEYERGDQEKSKRDHLVGSGK